MKIFTRKHSDYYWYLALFLSLLPLGFIFLSQGFWVSDDGEWMIVRLAAFYQDFRNGQIPTRFLGYLNHNYGYPVSNFLYPGFLYLGSLLHGLGLGFTESIKGIFYLGILMLAFGFFLYLRRFFQTLPSFIGALSAVYSPYVLFDIFHRGSVGEILALGFVPIIFFSIESKRLFLTSFMTAGLILAHNSVAAIVLPLIIIYMLFRNRRCLPCLIFALGLSAFFWQPAFFERSYTIFDSLDISQVGQYFLTGQNFFLINISGLLVAIMVFLISKKNYRNKVFIFFLVISCLALFLSSQLSSFLWKEIDKFVQFPWRFLAMMSISFPYFVALFISQAKQRWARIFISIFCLTLSVNFFSFVPKQKIDKGNSYYETNDDTTTVKKEYLPKWVVEKLSSRPPKQIDSQSGNARISLLVSKPSSFEFIVNSEINDVIYINKVYYPGWKIQRNTNNQSLFYVDKGLIRIPIFPGQERLRIFFSETTERYLADSISLTSLLLLIGIYIFKKSK